MAVSMRLKRLGNRNNPFFRIVVADQRSPRDGRFIEELGWYDPKRDIEKVSIKKERVTYWLSQGAQPSPTVKTLLKKEGVSRFA